MEFATPQISTLFKHQEGPTYSLYAIINLSYAMEVGKNEARNRIEDTEFDTRQREKAIERFRTHGLPSHVASRLVARLQSAPEQAHKTPDDNRTQEIGE